MNARSLFPARKNARPAFRPLDDAIPARPASASPACCCPARPTVRVTMSATQARPHETELLLCGHHYRASRAALAVARAVVRALPGTSDDIAAWIGIGSLTRA